MEISAGFTLMAKAPTIIRFFFLNMGGCGQTDIPFLIFIHPLILIGTNTICPVLNLDGSKDFLTKPGSGGEEFLHLDSEDFVS